MPAGDRFKNWIEGLAESWKDRLRGWMASWVENGLNTYFNAREPEVIQLTRETMTKLQGNPDTPPELLEIIDKSLATGDIYSVVMGYLLTVLGFVPALLGQGAAIGNIMNYHQERQFRSYRLNPQEVITAWRRDPGNYEKYFDDLRDQGWSEDRLLALRFFTEFFPNVQDIIRFAVREAYTPEIAEQFGQYEDLPSEAATDLSKIGLPWEQFRKYWAAHWDLPSAGQGFEMLHRGLIDEDTLRLLLRAQDVMPYWRDRLVEIAYNWPTRVDVRRWWDMRTIDEDRLRELYAGMGYHGKNLEDYVKWTKVYVAFPDLVARWRNGWITLDEVKAGLVEVGMDEERAEEMIQSKVKAEGGPRVQEERDLTKSDIASGVLKGVITRSKGMEMLQGLGYDQDEAKFIIDVRVAGEETTEAVVKERDLTKADILNAIKGGILSVAEGRTFLIDLGYSTREADILIMIKMGVTRIEDIPTLAAAGSPGNEAEFESLVQSARRATGQESRPLSEELKAAAAEVVRLTDEVRTLNKVVKDEEAKLSGYEIIPDEARWSLDEARTAYYRAAAELTRVQFAYQDALAKWKHGG